MILRIAVALATLGVASTTVAQSALDEPHSKGGQPTHSQQHDSTHGESQHRPQASASTQSEREHVPPDPPAHPLPEMSKERMVELMQMEDTAPVGMVLIDELEWRDANAGDEFGWDAQAWYGNDYDKAWLKAEGEQFDGETEGRIELLWNHVVARWWNLEAGARHDYGEGSARTWAAFGVQGLAPYWFEIEATVYAGEAGRTAARLSAEYELLLTQRWILQPELELNLYGKDDRENGIGSGLSDVELGLRLRYEIRRELAPYVGFAWTGLYGGTRDFARAAGEETDEFQVVLGFRAWF